MTIRLEFIQDCTLYNRIEINIRPMRLIMNTKLTRNDIASWLLFCYQRTIKQWFLKILPFTFTTEKQKFIQPIALNCWAEPVSPILKATSNLAAADTVFLETWKGHTWMRSMPEGNNFESRMKIIQLIIFVGTKYCRQNIFVASQLNRCHLERLRGIWKFALANSNVQIEHYCNKSKHI